MNIKLIDTPKPIGNFVNVRYSGNYAYISGAIMLISFAASFLIFTKDNIKN